MTTSQTTTLDDPVIEDPSVYLKLGKNTVLVKTYKTPGRFRFKLAFEPKTDPVQYRWWK